MTKLLKGAQCGHDIFKDPFKHFCVYCCFDSTVVMRSSLKLKLKNQAIQAQNQAVQTHTKAFKAQKNLTKVKKLDF